MKSSSSHTTARCVYVQCVNVSECVRVLCLAHAPVNNRTDKDVLLFGVTLFVFAG
jgi:hypothetical protein